ncbi:DUF11 domain-containing protein [Microbulbifer rhizosphaerae]|uniref:Putative repeat protein (TIGR01451 family)/fimbrial isopeptide formation D2 family protein n=1 Tax=Microbulbifer rhizosphaerae TaxID=1562603 RepID=A0A7W4W8E5_9GAMM|nr:DUF11 domain-containing protein [Microbulbifer rhizosphaerae]MBB3059625.1 putative repeat protein (TIGR01451 family)/fimbrial isopeptide formation D2 family protein [Microbulbifer rhizosphaerae]
MATALLLVISGGAWADYGNICVADEENPPTNLVTVQNSYCEFCGYGFVEVQITNPYRAGTNTPDGEEPYETQVIQEWYNPPGPGGGSFVDVTQSRRNPDYGSPNPALDFGSNGLTIALTNGLERYTGVAPTLPLGGGISGSSTVTISNMSDLAPGQTVTVRIPVHRSPTNSPESLYGTTPQATATINYTMADGCNDNPGRRHNWRNGGWYDNFPPDPNNPPTEFWQSYNRPANQHTGSVDIRQPGIALNKQGWNYDSGQRLDTRSDQIFGHNDDDIVWRINIRNTGNAPLQDLRIDDVLSRADVMDANYVCPTAAAADAVAANNGTLPVGSSCVATDAATGTVLANWDVDAPFGDNANVGNPYATTMNNALAGSATDAIDISQGGNINLYVVGKIHDDGSCASGQLISTFNDVEFGCAVQTPPGGIDSNQSETARLDTYYGLGSGTNALRVERQLTGITGTGPVGMRGLMTITLRNEGRGTVWFDPSMAWHLRDVLPDEYVVDPSYEPTIENAYSLYGAYLGRVDNLEWVNAQGAIPGNTSDTTSYLNNSEPQFKLTSNSSDTDADQAEESTGLMRHGDVVVIRFAVVMKDADYFDRAADLDVQQEDPSTNLYQRPERTDPDLNSFSSFDNTLEIQIKTLCDTQGVLQSTMTGNGQNNTFAATDTGMPVAFAPEELDISINQPTFILTDDRSQTTPLSVTLTNRGGDEARDFRVFISFGATINVVNDMPPAGFSCAPVAISQTGVDGNGRPMGQPDPYKVWAVNPGPDAVDNMHMLLPVDGTVYQCQPDGAPFNAALAAGASATFEFEVNKTTNPSGIAADDLTFRADVVGEIFTLSDFTIAATQVSANTVNVNQVTNGGNRGITGVTVNNPTSITNGDPLWFPAPGSMGNARSDGEVDRGNLYSLDTHWSRGIGFNLKKDQVTAGDTSSGNFGEQPDLGHCNENIGDVSRASANTFPGQTKPAEHVQIGEECTVRIQTGGWFGFDSRGFNFIGVRDIQVLDQIPNGQSYISSTVPLVTPQIAGATQGPNDPSTTPLNELSPFGWRFSGNQVSGYSGAPNEGTYIVDIDQWFTINATSRLLNKVQNDRAAPNQHGSDSANVLDSNFKGIFLNSNTGQWEELTFGSYAGGTTVGYPKEPIRRVDVVVTEPLIEVVKEICEVSNFNAATGTCGAGWTADYQGAVTTNDYIYRLTVSSEDAAAGHPRTPVYDLIVEDTLPDLLRIVDLDTDGIDNDGDGVVDEGGGEGVIVGNVMNDGNGTSITFSHAQGVDGTGLRRLEPGASLHLYYRVDPDDRIAPSETLTNTVAVTYYDSLEGSGNDHGNQTVVMPGSGELGGARTYPAPGDANTEAEASLTFSEPTTEPKTISQLSETPLAGSGTQQVKIGEEIEYTLTAELPVAQLRNLTVTDELPTGLVCADAPTIDLSNDAPWNAAGFKRPNLTDVGDVTPTCTDNQVQWAFGDVVLSNPSSDRDPNRFTFQLTFIARVQNSAANDDGDTLANGRPATNATLEWRDESNNDHSLDYGQVDVQITEPLIALTKSWDASGDLDAGDVITITLTATNNGTANAYNLRIWDDLLDSEMTFVEASVTGSGAPDSVDISTFGANRPVFVWNPENPLAPGASREFSFQVRIDDKAQPLQQLNNVAHAAWTSLPGQSTALNPAGQIGADGALDGQRIGELPNADDAINDYETSSNPVDVTLAALSIAKEDITENGAATETRTIGAHREFHLEISLPEGVSNNVRITDSLAAGGTSYVLARNANYEISCSYQGIQLINGVAPAADCAAFTAVPAVDATGDVVWDIGTVDTDSEDDVAASAITPIITINYFARVDNEIVETQSGNSLRNDAVLTYDNGDDGSTVTSPPVSTAIVTAVEPELLISKAVTNTTGAANLAQGGDVLEYELTITHTSASSADALDINVLDLLPPEVQFNAGSASATINGAAVDGFVAAPSTPAAGSLVWGRENGDNSLDLPLGSTLVITYQATVVSVFGQPVTNEAYADWTSLDDNVTGQELYERHGIGCPAVTNPNNYCTGPAQAQINTEDNSGLEKLVLEDSYGDSADSTVRIGDTITYQLTLNLQPGTTNAVQVTDVLPPGLTLESFAIDDAAGGYVFTPVSQPVPPATGSQVWNLGNVTRELGTAAPLLIQYVARVTEDAGIPHVASTTLTNNASLTYTDAGGNPPAADPRLESSATITVLQPLVDSLTKTDRDGRNSPYLVTDLAGDVMRFNLHACNSGDAPAYSLQLTDDLPMELDEVSIENLQVSIDGSPVEAGNYTYTAPTARGGEMIFVLTNMSLDAGQCLDIDYDIGFYTDVGGDQIWTNNFAVDEYWSFPPSDAQRYGPVALPAPYQMSTAPTSVDPLQKILMAPADGTAAVGEEVVYQLLVPSTNTASAIHDVVITDELDPSLEIVSVAEISGNGLTVDDSNTNGNSLDLRIDLLPAGTQAQIEIRARVGNNTNAQAGHSFENAASYTYAETDGGTAVDGGAGSAATLTIVEPELTLAKTVANQTSPGNDPDAGDVLRFTLDLTAAGNPENSDAFDLIVNEQLSLGLELVPGSVTFGGAAIADPALTGDGVNTAQALDWNRTNSNLDIAAGGNSQLVFDAVVLDSVLAATDLSGTSRIEWTSLDEDNTSPYERNGSDGVGGLNDYVIENAVAQLTATNDSTIAKTRLDDSYGTGDAQLRVGDFVEYELRLSLPEGSAPNAAITDTLPQGLVFDGTLAVNGDNSAPFVAPAPFSHGDIIEPIPAGDPATGPTTVTWNIADLVNAGDNNAANDEFVIRYRARVLNQDAHPWPANNTPLTNNVEFGFDAATGAENRNDGETLDLLQPNLAVAITSNPADGSTLAPGDTVDYTVTITNSGSAPAYDTVFRDTIPLGLRQGGVTVQSTSVNGAAVADLAPVYDVSTGEAVWNFGTGTAYAIDPGQTLVMTYRVQADPNLGAGLNMQNAASVEIYYSLDDDDLPTLAGATATVDMREDYGPTAPQSVQFNTPNAAPLLIENTQPTASIGEPFRYRVTIPETPQTTALHDVRILLNLGASAADLVFVEAAKVSGSAVFTPINTGSDTDLVIEDTTNGIDVPPGEQVVVDITVRLRDVNPPNVDGLTFNNSASYNYNYENDNAAAGQGAGAGNTTADMTVVEPTDLTMTKTGPASVQSGLPGRFTLDVHNIGTGPAWDITVTDLLPNNNPGGMCETPPANFAAVIADGTGNTVATLNAGEHFNTAFDPANCTLTVTTVGATAAIPADHRLLFSYDAYLDADTADGDSLINIAGVELWHSWDSTGPDARQYTRAAPTDGTPGTLDHEDAYTITAAVPSVSFYKVVENVTSGDSPASTATPGDTLRYTLTLTNLSSVDVDDIAITDELGRLNSLPLYQSGSLQIVSAPAGADTSGTDAAGGAHGSGLLSAADLSLATGDSLEIVYEVALAAVIDNDTAVLNQAQVQLPGQLLADSDDPNINGADDPDVVGDEDPTQVVVESAPELAVEKISQDITGDADLLMPGDTLRYTITIENTGDENAIAATLRDQVPANTTYVPNSTTLNGAAVADVDGSTPLSAGLAINSPGEEEGFVGATEGTQPVTVTFDVTINDVRDGTIISNQGFVNGEGAGSGPFAEQPSDDPTTEAPDDPTIDIVGDVPLLIVQKTVEIAVDNVSAGIVDPGDTLRYTITVTNMGGVDATDAVLTDQVPADTTYVAGTTMLNGMAVTDNAGGMTRLDSGLPISSSDLTPPLPGAGEGVITSAQAATITFDVQVDADTATGTVISNQGSVATEELPLTLTDADGNPSNGAQPTEVVVGDAQQLSITKEVAVVGGGAALPGATLEYLVRVTNISAVPVTEVVITDDLLVAGEGVLTYVADSALLNGQPGGISVAGSVITADYGATYGELPAGEVATLRFQAKQGENLEIGYQVLNTAEVAWNDPPSTEQASVIIDVGGTPGIANLSGFLWHDVNFNDQLDGSERLLSGWTVELYFNNALLDSLQADEDGYFQFAGLVPNYASSTTAGGASYELRYQAPNATETTASLGNTSSDFTNGPQQITEIFVGSGSNPQNLNLPITPNGVVYDSVLRQPVSGAMLTLLRASGGQELPDRCFDDEKQQGQVVPDGGYYKFDINFSDAACPANADYLIQVQVPGDGYVDGQSLIIPPQTDEETAGFDVGACLGSNGDVVPGTADHCEVQESFSAPGVDVDARDPRTDYYLRLTLDDDRIPGESQLFNNHIPVDPLLEGALSITKTASMLNVTRSQLVPYTITFSNTLPVPLADLQLVDFFPAGFKYVAGSARLDGLAEEPEVEGLQLHWNDLRVDPDQTRTVKLLLVVGSGVGEGKYVNRAQMFNQLSGQAASGEASATVRVVPDPTFDCSDVIGKVYDDKNMNGYQDQGEGGVPGARVVTATGLNATTDAHGRFHITCAVVPNRDRGSNFIMKLDDRSLPSGYRLTSENPRVVRATRGKAIKVNFGASLHRVVRLDMAEGVFEPETTELRPQWHSRTELLLEKLSEAPSVLRLSYLAENEDPDLVERRLQTIKAQIAGDWAEQYGDYELTIETEVFWRRGAPPKQGGLE